jgi:hypothetical protein
MAGSLKLIFADCFACGMRKTWAENQLAEAQANEFEIEKVPFYADGAAEAIRKGIEQGVNIPFFFDGEKCSKNVADFIEVKAPKKKSKRRVKKVEAEDES